MSAILAILDRAGTLPSARVVDRMLARMRSRGAAHVQVWRDEAMILAVAREIWELEPGFSDGALVVTDGEVAIAADASLYYCEQLRGLLAQRGVRPRGTSASDLILAAYRVWGENCARYVEGDFAFIVWDAHCQRMLCARDFGGKRDLYYGEFSGTLVVASSIAAVVEHPRCPGALNFPAIAATAATLFGADSETCYESVHSLPAAHTLERVGDTKVRLFRHWELPAATTTNKPQFEEAAEELSRLLSCSVAERLPRTGPTALWLSGGWDSTAVFGSASKLLRDRGARDPLQAVSVSYPPGDPGREDELIASVAEYWSAPVHWLDIETIPLFDRSAERAALRDSPYAHLFESFNRALARASRVAGARVAFDGSGGDQLFAVSDVFMADLLRSGQWGTLAREWRLLRDPDSGSTLRAFLDTAVKPLLPWRLRRAVGDLRGRQPIRIHFERALPPWFKSTFVRKHDLLGVEWRNTPSRESGWSEYEMKWFVTSAYFPRVFATVFGFASEEGVDVRSPLYDRRIVEFAATRPREERYSARESKRLLRRAARNTLPDHILDARPYRTGVASGYLERGMLAQCGDLLRAFNYCSVLQDLGIVDSSMLASTWERFLRGGARQMALGFFATLQTEMWLRAHFDRAHVTPAITPTRRWIPDGVPCSANAL